MTTSEASTLVKDKAFTVRIPREVRLPAKNKCNELEVSLGSVIIELLRGWVESSGDSTRVRDVQGH
jgi:virulence-associated protein VagC